MKINPSLLAQFFFCILFSLYGKMTFAQDCELPTASLNLINNNISARINVDGNLFSDGYEGALINPISEFPFKSTISNIGLWVGAQDSNGNTKIATSGYAAGPIQEENGEVILACEDYNQLWEVFGFEIEQHLADFEDNGIVDNPITNVFNYPGHGNPYFELNHGFQLPDTEQGLAPFFDKNNDGIYNPSDGDYPLPDAVAEGIIPTHIILGVFNDTGFFNTFLQSEPLNIEIQLTAWVFNCTDNAQINNTAFTSHKIINRGTVPLDSVFVGLPVKNGLGCNSDDYFGSIPLLNTFFLYNNDNLDGDFNGSCPVGIDATEIPTYGNNLPVQAVSLLNHSMSSLGYHYPKVDTWAPLLAPNQPDEFYNCLNGTWRDGTPYTKFGTAYNPNDPSLPTIKFVFPERPSLPIGWSMNHVNNSFDSPLVTISSTKVGTLPVEGTFQLDHGYTFFQYENLDNIETADSVFYYTPMLQQAYDNQFVDICDISNNVCEEDCVWTGDANRDSIVNTCDFLQIGVAQGNNGTPRNKPLIWSPYDSDDWNIDLNGVDLKHTDCSGDGSIDAVDFQLSELYFQNSYKTTPLENTYEMGEELTITTSSNNDLGSINVGEVGRCIIRQNQTIDLYGITFTLEYDTTFLEWNSSFGVAISAPWNPVPLVDNYYKFNLDTPLDGNIPVCFVKTNGENSTSKEGNILNVFFIPKASNYAQIQTFIKLKNIKAILKDGTQIDYGANELEVNIFNPDGSGVLLNNEDFANENIEIFPNPTTHLLNVKFKKETTALLSIFDIYGENVFQQKVDNNKETNLTSGIYFLKIKMDGKEITHKFVKI